MIPGGPGHRPTALRLIGRYPVPALHLVGAGRPPGPRATSRWQSTLLPQHGIDYTIARRRGLAPVRWRPGMDIAVRLTGVYGARSDLGGAADATGMAEAVETVVTELRALTGLALRVGQSLARPFDIRQVQKQEIHVAYLSPAAACQTRRAAGDGTASGGALPTADSAWYERGWAIVDTELATGQALPPDALRDDRPAALSTAALAVLRHQFCHALGLGHAIRRWTLMRQQIPVDLDGYSPGDRHGLALLGGSRPVPHDAPQASPLERTIPCR